MKKALLFLFENFEETEAIVTIDILRRGGVFVKTVSLTGEIIIPGSHNITVFADEIFENINDIFDYDCLVLPGGPGTDSYLKHDKFLHVANKYNEDGKIIAAICAAPKVLAHLGILDNKNVTCYPSVANELYKANVVNLPFVTDSNIITAKGAGVTMDFAFAILEKLTSKDIADKTKEAFIAKE